METDLKHKTKTGLIWSAVDRFSGQAIQFVLGIFLARLLSPNDYGIIGMLTIFLAVSDSIVDSGFGNALIQKKNRNQTDYSTVFYFNSIVGILLYIILFIAAPYIANFYNMPILCPVTRVMALNLVFNSLMIVQNTRLTIELNFKLIMEIKLIAHIIAGAIALYMAYCGLGVWALVLQMVSSNFIICVLFWILAKWRPSFNFSWDSFKSLFSFGSKLLVTGLYGPIYNNINTLIIGKFYSSASLGFYTRAQTFVQFPSSNITQIISRVSYPVLSSMQDNDDKLRITYRRLIKNTYFIVFPLMLGLMMVSESVIKLLLTEKWLECVPYMQILCVSMAFYPICSYNINLLLVKGKSGLHLKLDLCKKIVGLLVLSFTAFISIEAICWGTMINALFSWVITAYFSGRLIGLNIKSQIKDILPSFIITLLMCICIYILPDWALSSFMMLIIKILVGAIIYVCISFFFNTKSLKEVFEIRK